MKPKCQKSSEWLNTINTHLICGGNIVGWLFGKRFTKMGTCGGDGVGPTHLFELNLNVLVDWSAVEVEVFVVVVAVVLLLSPGIDIEGVVLVLISWPLFLSWPPVALALAFKFALVLHCTFVAIAFEHSLILLSHTQFPLHRLHELILHSFTNLFSSFGLFASHFVVAVVAVVVVAGEFAFNCNGNKSVGRGIFVCCWDSLDDVGIGSVDGIAQVTIPVDSGELDGVNVVSLADRNGFIDTRRGEPCGGAGVAFGSRSFGTEMCLWGKENKKWWKMR